MTQEKLRNKLQALAAIPPAVRAEMVRHADEVRPGAADALQRFYAAIRRLKASAICPPRACYDLAAKSEPTLATLLRALERFAPGMNLSEGRPGPGGLVSAAGRQGAGAGGGASAAPGALRQRSAAGPLAGTLASGICPARRGEPVAADRGALCREPEPLRG